MSLIRRPAISETRRPQQQARRTRIRLSQVLAERSALRCRSLRTAASSRRDRIFVASTRIAVPMYMRCLSRREVLLPAVSCRSVSYLGGGGKASENGRSLRRRFWQMVCRTAFRRGRVSLGQTLISPNPDDSRQFGNPLDLL